MEHTRRGKVVSHNLESQFSSQTCRNFSPQDMLALISALVLAVVGAANGEAEVRAIHHEHRLTVATVHAIKHRLTRVHQCLRYLLFCITVVVSPPWELL